MALGPPRIGISLQSAYPAEVEPRSGAAWLVERTAAARAAGLTSVFLGDQHATGPMNYYQNAPMMGRLLAEWGEQTAGILALLPLWNPVLLAEQVGTLAAIARGPFVLQVGLGGGQRQFAAMGADLPRRVSAFESALERLRHLLDGREADGVRVAPAPSEPVEVWVGADAPPAIERAARLGDGFLAAPSLPPPAAAERARFYEDACGLVGRTPGVVGIRRDIYVGASAEEAEAVAGPIVAAGYRGFPPDAPVVGSAEQVAEAFAQLGDAGYTDVIVRNLVADQSHALASIERLDDVRALLR